MEKRFLTLFTAAGLLLAMGCSGQNGAENNDTANTANEEEISTAFLPTDRGVEPIVLGIDVKDIPASVDGLYDNVVEFKDWEEFVDYRIYTFTSNGDTVMQAWAYDANYDKVFNIANINVYPKANVKMQILEGEKFLNVYDASLEPERPSDYE